MSEPQAAYRTRRIIELSLPWPDNRLSPNTRGAWYTKQDQKRSQRTAAFEIGASWGGWKPEPRARLELRLMFFPPDQRHRDIDNLHAALKSALDGLSLGLGVNDWQFKRTVLEWGAVDKEKPAVLVEIVEYSERGSLAY